MNHFFFFLNSAVTINTGWVGGASFSKLWNLLFELTPRRAVRQGYSFSAPSASFNNIVAPHIETLGTEIVHVHVSK